MIDYGRFKLSFNEAKAKIEAIDNMSDTEYSDQVRHWAMFDVTDDTYGEIYKNVREEIVSTFKQALKDNNNRIDYSLDLKVGLKLYELLNMTGGFDIVKANDDDIWRYISVCVMPDLTFIRYPNQSSDVDIIREYISGLSYAIAPKSEKDSVRIKKKRFYSHTRRIWCIFRVS